LVVITGGEAGDRAPSRCSAAESTCWPIVGGERLPVVDTWTDRPLCTVTAGRPPAVPCLSLRRPQAVGTPGMRVAGRDRPTRVFPQVSGVRRRTRSTGGG